MEILFDKVKDKGLELEAKRLASEFMITRDMHRTYGDMNSNIDPYLHAFSQAYEELHAFIDSNELVEYTKDDYLPRVLANFADDYYTDPENKIETYEYRDIMYKARCKVFERFVSLVYTLAYHRHRFFGSAEDKEVEERNCYFTWLELRKYNRDNNLLRDFTDEQLMMTLLEWFNMSILPKNPKIFDRVDVLRDAEVVQKYTGPRPNIPASEMADGYDFDIGI